MIGKYRGQEARLTLWLRGAIALTVAAAAFIAYAIFAGQASAIGTAVAGTLTCVAAAGRLRARRDKVRRFMESGAIERIAAAADAESDPSTAGPQALFSQQFCRVSRAVAGGRLQAGPVPSAFLVVVRDVHLSVIEAPGNPCLLAPAAAIQIQKPPRQLLGAGTVLRAGPQLWLFDFSGVYAAEQRHGALRSLVAVGNVSGSVHRGREVNDRFVAALLQSGANAAVA